MPRPKLAVAGLNPHAGEHGCIGSEEDEVMRAGDRRAAARAGIDVAGPFPADTMFLARHAGASSTP